VIERSQRSVMSVSRWWQLGVGAVFGAVAALAHPVVAVLVAIVVGVLLAWASLTRDGDDATTAVAAGYLTGVLGWGLVSLVVELTWSLSPGAT
jgi:apolipoprotein N-acyltransferase